MKKFTANERKILELFQPSTKVEFQGNVYTIETAGKPICEKGEPKTDIYLLLSNNQRNKQEIKISYKMNNADFVENKITANRAKQIFGEKWQETIKNSIEPIKGEFNKKKLVYKVKSGHTKKGSITLGWKFELVNKNNGKLSGKIGLNFQQVKDVYAGTNLLPNKKNAKVNDITIEDSGVANYLLMSSEVKTAQDVIDKMIPIDDYVKCHPKLYIACKALNYRSFEDKFDGNRPLAVGVQWEVSNNKLNPSLLFNNPLEITGNEMESQLKLCMEKLNIKTTDDINSNNMDLKFVEEGNN